MKTQQTPIERCPKCNLEMTPSAAQDPRAVQSACKKILNGTWTFINSTTVDLPTHYAVQQYRDDNGLVQTVTMTREGNLVTITA
jgi:hypothetical protein